MTKLFLTIFGLLFLVSCDYFKQEAEQVPVARVNDSYLYEKDIRDLISQNTSAEDSILIVNNFINRWATQQLLIDQAKINLSQQKLDSYDKLVSEYKNDLYTEAYKNAIVLKQLDTTVSEDELQNYYELYKDNFKLNNELLKLRYIHLPENYSDLSATREKLNRFNEEDKQDLLATSIQFKALNLNDSIWVKKETVFEALPALAVEEDKVLKKSNFAQIQDSLGVYLVKIEDIIKPNDIAPLSFVKPTIEQIILNKRKLELIKKLETDITKDAIKNKKFEIYTPQ
ncbi:peptidylprolyl isomerase [Constantimarinum furrinae]|uniref:Peptidyl-prolyl cis-trans isomerase n=1 Tax=Constantimarinum furrinae TaxID=2562285 RepID=A0A7G8PQN2_9FLAO|nr:peptidyl-prolyl cis-trans isomerase [Constantimarinum furrinae]QNJ96648.1 hypothetical protein ALE3EI_0057 [Constantimarinum furrinae]